MSRSGILDGDGSAIEKFVGLKFIMRREIAIDADGVAGEQRNCFGFAGLLPRTHADGSIDFVFRQRQKAFFISALADFLRPMEEERANAEEDRSIADE